MPSLLINADDFGLTPGVNRAIAELHDAGVLTSTTLMATGQAFDDAVCRARTRPSLSVGCHIVLVNGTPVLPPRQIPSLLGPDGTTFRTKLSRFVRDLMLGRLREDELEQEAAAQIRKLQQAGLRVTHIDSHKHAHLFPAIARPLARAALACGIHSMRNPFEPRWSSSIGGNLIRTFQVRTLARLQDPFFAQFDPSVLATPSGSLGISATGHLNSRTLSSLLHSLPEGVWELVCHPGYNDAALAGIATRLRTERETEYAALLEQVPHALRINSGLRLISYQGVHPVPHEAE